MGAAGQISSLFSVFVRGRPSINPNKKRMPHLWRGGHEGRAPGKEDTHYGSGERRKGDPIPDGPRRMGAPWWGNNAAVNEATGGPDTAPAPAKLRGVGSGVKKGGAPDAPGTFEPGDPATPPASPGTLSRDKSASTSLGRAVQQDLVDCPTWEVGRGSTSTTAPPQGKNSFGAETKIDRKVRAHRTDTGRLVGGGEGRHPPPIGFWGSLQP